MRRIKKINQVGDRKVVTRFLLWPRTIINAFRRETRWLERTTMEYEYQLRRHPTKFGYHVSSFSWVLVGFVEN
jgi:hypothetical protein